MQWANISIGHFVIDVVCFSELILYVSMTWIVVTLHGILVNRPHAQDRILGSGIKFSCMDYMQNVNQWTLKLQGSILLSTSMLRFMIGNMISLILLVLNWTIGLYHRKCFIACYIRKSVEKLLHSMLLCDHVGYSLVPHLLPCLRSLHSSPDSLVNYLAETVAEIRQPITTVEKSVGTEERRKIDVQVLEADSG